MALPLNIEKSVFRAGEYVGYDGKRVWRVKRSTGEWVAIVQDGWAMVHGKTLKEIGEKIMKE